MKETNLRVKVTSGILAGLMIVSVGAVSYASNAKTSNTTKNKPQTTQQNGRMEQKVDFKAKLAELVTAGSITQAQSDKIVAFLDSEQATKKAEMDKVKAMTDAERKAYFEANKPEKTTPLASLESLVTDGTLTQAQADLVVKAIMPGGRGERGDRGNFPGQPPMSADSTQPKLTAEEMQAKMAEQIAKQKAELTATLTDAVANGTITQAKADELVTYLDKKDAERKAQMEANKDKKPEDFKKGPEATKHSTEAKGPFGSAVTDGIITADQAKAINDILRAKQEAAKSQATVAELTKIVTAGTITQAQADKVIATLDAEKATKIAEQEKVAAMTDTERKAYFEANKTERAKPLASLASLVTDGTLTQEQADTIIKAIMRDNGFGREDGRHGGPNGQFKAPTDATPTSTVTQ